jgi:hypothetical protein
MHFEAPMPIRFINVHRFLGNLVTVSALVTIVVSAVPFPYFFQEAVKLAIVDMNGLLECKRPLHAPKLSKLGNFSRKLEIILEWIHEVDDLFEFVLLPVMRFSASRAFVSKGLNEIQQIAVVFSFGVGLDALYHDVSG